MNDVYETDLLLWSERQAALLRRVAVGERVNDQVDLSTSTRMPSFLACVPR